jgi:hypothetical protein
MIRLNLLKPNYRTPLQKALDDALAEIHNRSFSQRNPHLGKMINCPVCSTRHRQHEKKCEQVFTYRIGDYEFFRDDENGNKVPDYRTAVRPGEKPTVKQQVGRAAFAKKRFHPHPSKIKLLFIEKTREVFTRLGFATDSDKATFEKNLQRARIVAAREIRREREFSDREYRRRTDQSRRINRGLI